MTRDDLLSLTGRQRLVLDTVAQYYRSTGDPCPASYVARRLAIHRTTALEHFLALHRKGWLRGPNAPAIPSRF
jgi:hypothetical protein